MKEFYVVLVTIALINCISLARITGPGFRLARPGGLTTSPDGPGTAGLFAISAAVLMIANTLFTAGALAIVAHASGLAATPWLIVILSITGAGLLLLPLTAWVQYRFVLSYQNLRRLLPVAAIEAMVLTSLLLLARPDSALWANLLWSLGAGAGNALMITVYAGLRLRLAVSDAPHAWRGLPLELVTAGILALALLSPTRAVL